MNMKKREIKYESELDLAGFKLPCYVLADGTRILSSRGIHNALKMAEEDSQQKRGPRLKEYLSQKSLQPFTNKEKERGRFEPIICYKGNVKIHGHEAT